MKLRPANTTDRQLLDGAIEKLKDARDASQEAGCPKVATKIRSALKSADGARRHMERRLMRTQDGTGKCPEMATLPP